MNKPVELMQNDFNRLSQFIHSEYGIKMPQVKRVLLESRLQKRLRALDIKSFSDYNNYLFSPKGKDQEMMHFIDKITTNKTDFFREPEHFDYLTQKVLPDLVQSMGGRHRPINVWSAGCSTGEEPFTLAMVMNEFYNNHASLKSTYKILGTDISMEVLQVAKTGVYRDSRVLPVPIKLKKKYLLRSKDKQKQLIKIVPELRSKIELMQLNLMDEHYPIDKQVDIIFCRNVIIYFDKPTQEQILNKLCRQLKVGGYLFQGHSESVHGLRLPLKSIYPTIYKRLPGDCLQNDLTA